MYMSCADTYNTCYCNFTSYTDCISSHMHMCNVYLQIYYSDTQVRFSCIGFISTACQPHILITRFPENARIGIYFMFRSLFHNYYFLISFRSIRDFYTTYRSYIRIIPCLDNLRMRIQLLHMT